MSSQKSALSKAKDNMKKLTLPHAFLQNPNLHAYLFVSGDFAVRRDMAALLAKTMLCENKNEQGNACGSCADCIKVQSKSHPDCIYVSGKEKTSVEDVRKIENEAYLAPNEANKKVFILENADEYNIQSQNALLKIIEEPPENVKFVLTASSAGALLPTVRSRVCTICSENVSLTDLEAQIKNDKPHLSREQIESLSAFSSFFDKTNISSLDENAFFEYMDKAYLFFSAKDKNAIMSLPKKREELMLCLQVFMLYAYKIALTKCIEKNAGGFISVAKMTDILSKVSTKRAVALYDTFEKAYLQCSDFANINVTLSFIWQSI